MSGFSPSASSFATDQAVTYVAAKRVPADDFGHLIKVFGDGAADRSQKLLLVCGLTVQNAGSRAWVAERPHLPAAHPSRGNGYEEANFAACKFVWHQ